MNAKAQDRIKALQAQKAQEAKLKAEHQAKVAQFTTTAPKKEVEPCACSGQSDSKKQGGHCALWGWRDSWCYVSHKCKDRGLLTSTVPPKLKWIQGCIQSEVANLP